MGIYGKPAKRLVQSQQPIVITLEDSTEENQLLEADIILSKNGGTETILFVRDSHSATKGGDIPKGNKISTMNHGSSIKLKSPKSITGKNGIPIEIHDNNVSFDYKKYPNLKKVPKQIKDTSIAFIKDNITILNDIWKKQDTFNDFENWSKIIDKNYTDIKKITGVSKEIMEYLDSKKGEDDNGKNSK